MATALYHATVSGVLSGLAFMLGAETFFTPFDDPTVYQVTDVRILSLIPVAPEMVDEYTRTVIEPRLQAQTGRAA